jgi:two-component system chemotaxis response regulator CheY
VSVRGEFPGKRNSGISEFKTIRTLIVDPTNHSKNFLRGLLTSLNVQHVVALANTDEALACLRQECFSIVFCDDLVGPLDPFGFLKALRRDLATSNVTVPVVLVSAGADFSKITAARDAGMNDVIAKPVSIGTIERKLRSLLLAPRPFVTAKSFVGPDRRGGGNGASSACGRRTAKTGAASRMSRDRFSPFPPRLRSDETKEHDA